MPHTILDLINRSAEYLKSKGSETSRLDAELLLAETLSISRDHGVKKIHLEVRQSNDQARRLYEKFGFQVIAVRPNYYTHPREDAVLMALDLE